MGGVIVKHDHKGGVIPDYHEVVWLGDSVYRDRIGRRHPHGWTRFAQVRCNNPECQYEALVAADVVAGLVA